MRVHPVSLSLIVVIAALSGFILGRRQSVSSNLPITNQHPTITPRAVTANAPAERISITDEEIDDQATAATGQAHGPVDILDSTTLHSFDEISALVVSMDRNEMAEMFVAIRESDNHPQAALIENILTFHLMGQYPETMLDLKLKFPDLPVLGRTYRAWAQSDPEAALAHAQALDNEVWNRTGITAVLHGIGDTDPQRALAALQANPELLGGHDYMNLYRSWSTRAPAEAAASVDGLPDEHREIALRMIADNWPEVDPAAAQNWFEGLPPEKKGIVEPIFKRRIDQLERSINQ